MPRVKIGHVVSFSSEDPEHPASNLLAWEVSKKKWLCKRGESSCSVVLQLTKAVKISSVHIGAYHSALVEVLVANSEKASDHFQVLVPSCVFVGAGEARRDAPVERVRSFSAGQLAHDTRALRWDRVRLVCAQPYNKHCKFGLSFIHIEEAGEPGQRLLALDTLSSDEDDFRPGELFAKHLQQNSDSQGSAPDTGVQIRQATSQALKNISESSTKLIKTPISKPSGKREHEHEREHVTRARDTLLYTDEDQRPHHRIDHVLQRHKEDKAKHTAATHDKKDKEKFNESVHKTKDNSQKITPKRKKSPPPAASEVSSKHGKRGESASAAGDQNDEDGRRKRPRLATEQTETASEESSEPHTLLKGVVLVLSGYENPQRAHLRNTALALGAQVRRDWGPDCTHLVCAFPNTPKLRAVRAADGARVTPAARARWLQQCSARRRVLPWRWFATEPQHLRPEPPPQTNSPRPAPSPRPPHSPRNRSDTECDTDDEIEKVLREQKAKVETTADGEQPAESDDTSADSADADSTDEERAPSAAPRLGGALPAVFGERTFVLAASAPDADTLARYVTAYGGLVLPLSQLEEDGSVDYVVCGRGACGAAAGRARGTRVSAAWLARCISAGTLLAPDG